MIWYICLTKWKDNLRGREMASQSKSNMGVGTNLIKIRKTSTWIIGVNLKLKPFITVIKNVFCCLGVGRITS